MDKLSAPTTCLHSVAVDAGIVTWPEYEQALQLLLNDPSVDLRTRQLNAMAWFLIFRFGARVSEALGIRRKDLVVDGERVIVLLRQNDYRDIKTDAGIRQVPLIGPLSRPERGLVSGWLDHIDAFADSDYLSAVFAEAERPRRLMDRGAIERRLTEALRAVTGSDRIHLHHARHAFGSRLELLMTLDELPNSPQWRGIVERILGLCEPVQARRLLLDHPSRSKRGLWATALAMGHAGPGVSQRSYLHLGDLLASLHLSPAFDANSVALERDTLRYVTGFARLPASLAPPSSERTATVDLVFARRAAGNTLVNLSRLAVARPLEPRLPERPEVTPPPLGPARADHALDLAHRRGRIDGIARTLLVPADQIEQLFRTEYRVRAEAAYDIRDSGWIPTPASAAVSHHRAGARLAAETRRVRPFLRALEARLVDDSFRALTRAACAVWQDRYKADRTPLVLADGDELRTVLSWIDQVGIPREQVEVRVPADGLPRSEVAAAVQAVGFDPGVVVDVEHLPSARSRFRTQGRARVGFLLRENTTGPLTAMAQLHRVMHVLAAVLERN